MKFDEAKVASHIRALGDPQFAGVDGEAKVADFLSEQLARMGLVVDRRDAARSRVSGRMVSWIDRVGYGFLITSIYGLVLTECGYLVFLGWMLSFCGTFWNVPYKWARGRLDRPRRPLEQAPVVIASRPTSLPGSVRVVFQSALSGVKVDPLVFAIPGPILASFMKTLPSLFPPLWASALVFVRVGSVMIPGRADLHAADRFLTYSVFPVFLAAAWIGIVVLVIREHRDLPDGPGRAARDRRGLALLLELARSWPQARAKVIDPLFLASGAHLIDPEGTREVSRVREPEHSPTPLLWILFFEPGAGQEVCFSTNDPRKQGLAEMVEDAAQSLWIPCRCNQNLLNAFHPRHERVSAVALIGSDPRAFRDASPDPVAIHRTAQLATEIALRWAKRWTQFDIPGSDDPAPASLPP